MSYDQRLLIRGISERLQRNPNLSLATLSGALAVSRRTIQATIRAQRGETFRQFQKRVLIGVIGDLLVTTPNLTIKELSFQVGYKSPQSFARAVKGDFGITPEKLRSQVRILQTAVKN